MQNFSSQLFSCNPNNGVDTSDTVHDANDGHKFCLSDMSFLNSLFMANGSPEESNANESDTSAKTEESSTDAPVSVNFAAEGQDQHSSETIQTPPLNSDELKDMQMPTDPLPHQAAERRALSILCWRKRCCASAIIAAMLLSISCGSFVTVRLYRSNKQSFHKTNRIRSDTASLTMGGPIVDDLKEEKLLTYDSYNESNPKQNNEDLIKEARDSTESQNSTKTDGPIKGSEDSTNFEEATKAEDSTRFEDSDTVHVESIEDEEINKLASVAPEDKNDPNQQHESSTIVEDISDFRPFSHNTTSDDHDSIGNETSELGNNTSYTNNCEDTVSNETETTTNTSIIFSDYDKIVDNEAMALKNHTGVASNTTDKPNAPMDIFVVDETVGYTKNTHPNKKENVIDSVASSPHNDTMSTAYEGSHFEMDFEGSAPATNAEAVGVTTTAEEMDGHGETEESNVKDAICNDTKTWQSSQVWYSDQGDSSLSYNVSKDSERNRIPDFSYVGYGLGDKDIPNVPVVHEIYPASETLDNTRHLQEAIDYVGKLPKDNTTGFRGALLLRPGLYRTHNPVYVPYDGVVIRGSGDGENPSKDTIIFSKRSGTDQDVFHLGAKDSDIRWDDQDESSRSEIKDSIIPIGQRNFDVAEPEKFRVGDLVIIESVPNDRWYSAVDEGGVLEDTEWSKLNSDDYWTIRYVRFISSIEGNRITVDSPFYAHLNKRHGKLQMALYNKGKSPIDSALYYNLGIENMRIEVEATSTIDEKHTANGVIFEGVIDGWARNMTVTRFVKSAFWVTRSYRITVQNCCAGPPASKIAGARRYNFNVEAGGQNVLFQDCLAIQGRHGFVSNGMMSASGIVVVNSELRENISGSEGHRHWTLGMLFDSSSLTSHYEMSSGRGYMAWNRQDYGTSHGWGSVNSVLWNIDSTKGTMNVVENPPTAQNYAIGVDYATGDGFIEGRGKGSNLCPPSLYYAQLKSRRVQSERE